MSDDGPDTPWTRFTRFLNGGIGRSILGLVFMRYVNSIDFDNETNLLFARLAYFASFIAQLILMWIIHRSIYRTKDYKQFSYFTPGSSLSQTPDEWRTVSNYDYDMKQLQDMGKGFFIPAIVTLVAHFRYGYVQPLILQIVFPWMQYLNMPVVKVHALGKKAEGDLKRPWKGGLEGMFSGGAPRLMSEKEYERYRKGKAKAK